MGEAKRKQTRRAAQDQAAAGIDMTRVALAVNRLCVAASSEHGSDCLLQADLAQHLLGRLGVRADVVAGAAAWRVGEDDGDVISHIPSGGEIRGQPAPGYIPFHAWLRVGQHLLDVTTADLEKKAEQLDYQDGGHIEVVWAPECLYVPYSRVSDYRTVAQGHAGLFFYREDAHFTQVVRDHLRERPQDVEMLEMLWMIYQNPQAKVFGPENLPALGG